MDADKVNKNRYSKAASWSFTACKWSTPFLKCSITLFSAIALAICIVDYFLYHRPVRVAFKQFGDQLNDPTYYKVRRRVALFQLAVGIAFVCGCALLASAKGDGLALRYFGLVGAGLTSAASLSLILGDV